MITVGLTGGIGAGKSTVARLLVERGAHLVDADVLARRVVLPGEPAFARIVERFGDGVVAADGSLDRNKLADLVFADRAARADLNAIVHPEIGRLMMAEVAELSSRGGIVVLDIPLLVEEGVKRYAMAGVVVVDLPTDLAIARLVSERNMDPKDAERRVAAQVSREERLRIADYVIMNDGTLAQLEAMVALAWAWMCSLASPPA